MRTRERVRTFACGLTSLGEGRCTGPYKPRFLRDQRVLAAILVSWLTTTILALFASASTGSELARTIKLPPGARLIGMLPMGRETCGACGIQGLIVLSAEPWPSSTAAASQPTLHIPATGPFGVLRFYSLIRDGIFTTDPRLALPLYLEEETRAYPGGGQVLLEPKWPIALKNPEAILGWGCEIVIPGTGWPLDRRASIAAGGENPVIGFQASLFSSGLGALRVLNHEQFITDRDVTRLLLSQTDPLFSLVKSRQGTIALLVLESEMTSINNVQGYALRVYKVTSQGLVQSQVIMVGERGVSPSVLVAGDVNSDGYDDVMIGFRGPLADRITVLLNNTDGTFRAAPGQPLQVSESDVRAIVLGDFDGSGTADLIVMGPERGTLFKGDGTGMLRKAGPFAWGTGSTGGSTSVVAADFNRDGKSDLAIARGSEIWVVVARGGGEFSNPERVVLKELFASAEFAADILISMEVGDDLSPDLLVGSRSTGEIGVLMNRGGVGGAVSFWPVQSPELGAGPTLGAAGDVTGDKVEDLVLVYPKDRVLRVHRGSDHGIETSPVITRSISPVIYPSAIAIGDFDGDGFQDVALACGTTDRVVVLYGPHDRQTGIPRTEVIAVGGGPSDLLVCEEVLGGTTGKKNLLVLNSRSHNLYTLAFDSSSCAQLATIRNPGGTQLDLEAARLAAFEKLFDPSADGTADLLLLYLDSGRLFWIDGRQVAEAQPIQRSLGISLAQPVDVVLADVNRDNAAEIVAVEKNALRVFVGERREVCCSGGKIEYVLKEVFVTPIVEGICGSRNVVVTDVTGDGVPDIVIATCGRPYARVWAGRGDGTFSPIETDQIRWTRLDGEVVEPTPLSGLIAARVESAGGTQLIGYSEIENRVVLLSIPPEPRDGKRLDGPVSKGKVSDGVIADVDGDCRNELVLALQPDGTQRLWKLLVLRAPLTESGLWESRELTLASASPQSPRLLLRAEDLNMDQRSELVLLDSVRNRISILWGPDFSRQEDIDGLPAGCSTLAVGAGRDGKWIAAGSTLFWEATGSWNKTQLDLGGRVPLRAWTKAPKAPGVVPDLMILAHRSSDNSYWLMRFDGAQLMVGCPSPQELVGIPVNTKDGKLALRVLLSYSGLGDPVVIVAYVSSLFPTEEVPISLTLADFDGEGGPDLIGVSPWLPGTGRMSVWYTGKAKPWEGPSHIIVPCELTPQTMVLAGDLTGNGRSDIVILTGGAAEVAVIFNGGGRNRTEVVSGVRLTQRRSQ